MKTPFVPMSETESLRIEKIHSQDKLVPFATSGSQKPDPEVVEAHAGQMKDWLDAVNSPISKEEVTL